MSSTDLARLGVLVAVMATGVPAALTLPGVHLAPASLRPTNVPPPLHTSSVRGLKPKPSITVVPSH